MVKTKTLKITKEDLERSFYLFVMLVYSKTIKNFKTKPFHKEWMSFQCNNKYSLFLGPRTSGKSEILDMAYCVWRIVKNPDIKIIIVSKSASAAQEILGKIADMLKNNEIIKELWGEFYNKDCQWNKSAITVAKRTRVIKDPTVLVTGVGGQLASYHADVIIVDDVVDDKNSVTQTSRETMKQWFGSTCANATEVDHEIHIIGTRYHPEDFYDFIIKNQTYKTFIQDCYVDDDSVKSFWPERFTINWLNKKRLSVGDRNFNLQFRNKANLVTGGIFKAEWIDSNRYSVHSDDFKRGVLPNLMIYQSIDIAIGTKQSSDYFVVLTVGYQQSSADFWILDMDRGRYTPTEHMGVVKKNYQIWKPIKIIIEANNYQEALSDLVRAAGVPAISQRTHRDKELRMYDIQGHFEANKVHIPIDDKFQPIVDELKAFPSKYTHDDTCDALEIVIKYCKEQGFVGTIDLSPWDDEGSGPFEEIY